MNTQPYKNTREGINIWKDTPEPAQNGILLQALNKASKHLGQYNYDDPRRVELFKFTASEIKDLINDNYSWFSTDEIQDVFYLWALGKLGDNITISVRSIAGAFNVYLYDYRPYIAKAVREETPKLPPSTVPRRLTDDEAEQYLQDMYIMYHETGNVFAETYEILHRYGKIQNTKSEIERFLAKAEKLVPLELKERAEKGAMNVFDYVNTLNDKPSMEKLIDACTKRIAVSHLFDFMKLREKSKAKAKVGSLAGFNGKVKLKG